MLIPRQLAPTMGPAHGGVEFLEGSVLGFREVRDLPDQARVNAEESMTTLNLFNGDRRKSLFVPPRMISTVLIQSALAIKSMLAIYR